MRAVLHGHQRAARVEEEVGRELTRFPPYNLSIAGSYVFGKGVFQGLSLSGSWVYISDFVSNYEDRQRFRLAYPGYAMTNLSASYSKRIGKLTHGCSVAVRNVFDTDLLQKLHRLGAEREISASYRLAW